MNQDFPGNPSATQTGRQVGDYGLAVLVAMSGAEILETASPAETCGFYTAVGRRIAGLIDVAGVSDLDVLAHRINALMGLLGWGRVSLEFDETGILVRHRGAPQALEADLAGIWPLLLPALLEGAYDTWFRALGSGPVLVTRVLRQGGDLIELHHGS
jgi:hypothetical protein